MQVEAAAASRHDGTADHRVGTKGRHHELPGIAATLNSRRVQIARVER
jgi:hypothetical protein